MPTRKGGKPDLPKLMNTREFSAKYGHGWRWAWNMIRDGLIPAAQKVGATYIIPEDAIIIPRWAQGLPLSSVDFIPDELARLQGDQNVEFKEYETKQRTLGVAPYRQKLVFLPSLKKIRLANKLSQDALSGKSGCSPITIRRAEHGRGVSALTAVKLAVALEVDYEELMRDG